MGKRLIYQRGKPEEAYQAIYHFLFTGETQQQTEKRKELEDIEEQLQRAQWKRQQDRIDRRIAELESRAADRANQIDINSPWI